MNQPSPSLQQLPLPTIPDPENDSTMQSLLRRVFGRPLQSRRNTPIQESLQDNSEQAEELLDFEEVGADNDVYLKNVKLLLNGAPLQSLSSEDGERKFDYSQYFLFLKGDKFSGALLFSSKYSDFLSTLKTISKKVFWKRSRKLVKKSEYVL